MDMPRASVLVRWVAAAAISGSGVWLLASQLSGELNWALVFGKSLFGMAGLLTGILLISPETVLWCLTPVHRMLDHIFLPSESEPPPVDFTLARFYAQRMRYAEACVEYAKIIRYHPEQKAAYLEGIQAAGRSGDKEMCRRFYRRAHRVMCSPGERALLENVYAIRHELPVHAADEENPGLSRRLPTRG